MSVRIRTQEQKEKILAAASGLFGTQRFHDVRMDDIADLAAVGKGTLYRYFQDKEELYFAVLARSSEMFIERLTAAVAEVGGLRAQLEALAASIVAYFDEQPHLLDLIQRSELESATETEFPWHQTRLRLIHFVRDLFADAEERGEASIRNPELAVYMFFGGLRSVIRLGHRPRPRNLARCFVDNLLLGADVQARGPHRPTARVQALLR
jgi:AcrR family transcriptional regulator